MLLDRFGREYFGVGPAFEENKYGLLKLIKSSGRKEPDKLSDRIELIGDFSEDNRRIINSKAFRKLDGKTQVITNPANQFIRERKQHSLEAAVIGRMIAQMLDLNYELVETILLGHDIGHVAFGHLGERMLGELSGQEFKHEIYGPIVAQFFEKKGKGLNLTKETLEGILNHSHGLPGDEFLKTMINEYMIANYADKIQYVLADYNDITIRGITIKGEEYKIDPALANSLGNSQTEREWAVIKALVDESKRKGYVSFNEGFVFETFKNLRKQMTTEVYSKMDDNQGRKEQEKTIRRIYNYFENEEYFEGLHPVHLYAQLTEKEAKYLDTHMTEAKKDINTIKHFGMFETIEYVKGKDISFTDPKLDWEGYKTA